MPALHSASILTAAPQPRSVHKAQYRHALFVLRKSKAVMLHSARALLRGLLLLALYKPHGSIGHALLGKFLVK
jgi:hypothetical protein